MLRLVTGLDSPQEDGSNLSRALRIKRYVGQRRSPADFFQDDYEHYDWRMSWFIEKSSGA
jgi:hypothetical protein